MSYVEVAIIPVPKDAKAAYLDSAHLMAPMFKKRGATRVIEAWGNTVPDGDVTSFPLAVKTTEDETVVVSLVFWPSKAVRDEGMAKLAEDMQSMDPKEMPFDGKRMIFAEFDIIADV